MQDLHADNRGDGRLFASLAEQVKLPFVQILHESELIGDSQETRLIREISRSALCLIDGYLLQARLQVESELMLDSVSISSLLHEVSESLQDYAKAHDCELTLEVKGRFGPVNANREAFLSALKNLGYSMIDATSGLKHKTVTLLVRKQARGISAGVYAPVPQLTADLVDRAKQLEGNSHQPFSGLLGTNGAGVFVADKLLDTMQASMRVARSGQLTGLAATFTPSQQLALI